MERIEDRLKAEARRLGFSLSGIAPATDADGFGRYVEWLDAGYAGDMHYLHRTKEARRHPRSIVENVRSVLMLGMEYTSEPGTEATPGFGKVAKYARGPDYHRFVWDRENELSAWLMREVPGCEAWGVADTAPLLERDFARRAGLGWVGKNTMLIHKQRGSFFVLGAILTDLVLEPDPPSETNHCGTCTACLDACPTQAFPSPGVLDARRCISYLTIEVRTPIPAGFREPIGDWLWGCDVCQDVCPWNRFAGRDGLAFPVDESLAALDPVEVLGQSEDEFRARFKKTALWRNRRAGLRRNAAIVLGNVGGEQAIPVLEEAAVDTDEAVSEAAAWALVRVRQRTSNV